MKKEFFKFTDSRYVDCLLNGSIRVASLDYFRHLEDRTGDKWIGDKSEGQSHYTDTLLASPISGSAPRERLRQLGVAQGDDSSTFKITDFTMGFPHSLIFCFSIGDYAALRQAMCVEPDPHVRYDAALRMTDVGALYEQIWNGSATIFGATRSVSSILNRAESGFGPVKYQSKETSLNGTEVLPVSPFIKPTLYSKQSEFRIVLRAPTRFKDILDIRIPDAKAVFELVEKDMKVEKETNESPLFMRDRKQIASSLAELADEMDAWYEANPIQPWHHGMAAEEIRPESFSTEEWNTQQTEEADRRERCVERFGRRVSDLVWSAHLIADVCNAPFRERHRMLFPAMLFPNSSDRLREIAEIMLGNETW